MKIVPKAQLGRILTQAAKLIIKTDLKTATKEAATKVADRVADFIEPKPEVLYLTVHKGFTPITLTSRNFKSGTYRNTLKVPGGPNKGKVEEVDWDATTKTITGRRFVDDSAANETENVKELEQLAALKKANYHSLPPVRMTSAQKQAFIDDLNAVRKEYKDILKKSKFDWADDTGTYLSGMRNEEKSAEWLKEYYENLKTLVLPLEQNLLTNGELVHKPDGWYGLINNKMVPVDALKYIVSRLDSFRRAGLQYSGLGSDLTSMIEWGNIHNFGFNPERAYPIYTIRQNGPLAGILEGKYKTLNRQTKTHNNSANYRGRVPVIDTYTPSRFRTGDTESLNGGGNLGAFENLVQPTQLNGTDKGIDKVDIKLFPINYDKAMKSWWNNFNFDPAKGSFSYFKTDPLIFDLTQFA